VQGLSLPQLFEHQGGGVLRARFQELGVPVRGVVIPIEDDAVAG
jgi:hypothetical protein